MPPTTWKKEVKYQVKQTSAQVHHLLGEATVGQAIYEELRTKLFSKENLTWVKFMLFWHLLKKKIIYLQIIKSPFFPANATKTRTDTGT